MDFKKLKSGTDIRGVASEGVEGQHIELTDEVVFQLGRAFATWIYKGGLANHPVIAVGHDCRISGERIKSQVINALIKSGVNVIDCGLCTTPAMFMTTVLKGCDAAISITASHHPFNRNGLKFFTRNGGLDGKDISAIIEIAESAVFFSDNTYGKITQCEFLSEYAAYLRNMISTQLGVSEADKPLKNLHFVVDAGNGVGGFYATDVLAPLGAKINGSINLEPDGMFPNHTPNPEDQYAMECACKATVAAKADLGIIFDTDVDRGGAVGADGTEINRNRLVALAAAIALENCPNGTIVTDSVTSSGLKTFIEDELGGTHYRYRRGYKNVIDEAIRLTNAGQICPLAIETSGHAAFKDNYFLDDGAYLITRIIIKLAQLRNEGKSIEDLIASLKEPVERKELRINITEPDFKALGQKIISDLEQFALNQPNWKVADDNREGIRVFCNEADGWFLLRLSVHDPVMPLNFESDSVGGVEIMRTALKNYFKDCAGIDTSVF